MQHTQFCIDYRDLGEYLRDSINKAYKENKFESDQKFWDRQYLSLQKLVNNEHCKHNPRHLHSSSTGLTAEQCNIALSNEFLTELQNENEPFYKRIFAKKS